MKRLLGVSILTIVVAGCAEPQNEPVPAGPPPRSTVMTECGTWSLTQDQAVPQSVLRCFSDGVNARRPARFNEMRSTDDGGLISVTYVANNEGHVDVLIDSRRAKSGLRALEYQSCDGPIFAEDGVTFARCSTPVPIKG